MVRGLGGGAHRVAPRLVPVPQQPAVLAHVHLRAPTDTIGHSRMQRSCHVMAHHLTQPWALVDDPDANAEDADADIDAEDATTTLWTLGRVSVGVSVRVTGIPAFGLLASNWSDEIIRRSNSSMLAP